MDPINWHSFFFLLFALVTCVFAVAVVVSSNIVRMAFFLIVSLGATAGLFFLAGAAFVGAMQLLIYVGGTLVLLVFGVMLTAQSPFVSIKTSGGEWVLAAVVGGSLLVVLLQAAVSVPQWRRERARGTTDAADWYAQVQVQARQPGSEYVGVRVKFAAPPAVQTAFADEPASEHPHEAAPQAKSPSAPGAEGRVSGVRYDAETKTLVFQVVPGKTTAKDVVSALRRDGGQAGKLFAARLLKGSPGKALVSLDDRATLALTPPKTDVAAGEIGLALLGARTDDPRASGYLLPFEIISVHLLVVLIGAAYLARTKRRAQPKPQD